MRQSRCPRFDRGADRDSELGRAALHVVVRGGVRWLASVTTVAQAASERANRRRKRRRSAL
jgi:hypothetical protein